MADVCFFCMFIRRVNCSSLCDQVPQNLVSLEFVRSGSKTWHTYHFPMSLFINVNGSFYPPKNINSVGQRNFSNQMLLTHPKTRKCIKNREEIDRALDNRYPLFFYEIVMNHLNIPSHMLAPLSTSFCKKFFLYV